jgi:hypothetical protein
MQHPKEKPALFKHNCKYARSCHMYTKTSVTCTKKGGNYCGAYRELTARLQAQSVAQQQKIQTEVTFVINPDLYESISKEVPE